MNTDNIKIYDENAKQLAERYAALTTEEVLPLFTSIVKAYTGDGRQALDIGSGVGRDALWLAGQGWAVDAIDGSKGLLAEAQKTNPHPHISYRHDLAPTFNGTQKGGKQYNLILLSAFIFHFEKEDRQTILKTCRNFLSEAGLVYITLRKGPDVAGRNIFDVEAQEIEEFSELNGLNVQYHGRGKDGISPPGVTWDHLSLWRGAAWDHARTFGL